MNGHVEIGGYRNIEIDAAFAQNAPAFVDAERYCIAILRVFNLNIIEVGTEAIDVLAALNNDLAARTSVNMKVAAIVVDDQRTVPIDREGLRRQVFLQRGEREAAGQTEYARDQSQRDRAKHDHKPERTLARLWLDFGMFRVGDVGFARIGIYCAIIRI